MHERDVVRAGGVTSLAGSYDTHCTDDAAFQYAGVLRYASTDPPTQQPQLIGYTDSDWAADRDDRKSLRAGTNTTRRDRSKPCNG